MTNAKRILLQSIRAKLAAYAERREMEKLEALNEALDRALSVHRGDIGLKTASLAMNNFNQVTNRQKKID